MSQPIPLIRRASVTDARLLAELAARTFKDTFAVDNNPDDMAAYMAVAFSPAKQTEELADPLSVFLIAEVDSEAVGYAQLHAGAAPVCVTGDAPIELARLYVAQQWLGHKVGAALMRACIDEARQSGYQTLWLGVWERNPRARAFYRRWDFQEVGDHIFQLGSDPQTDIVMSRKI
jgi:diamine N-acetyltransferase